MLDDAIFDARAWALFALVLLGIVAIVLTVALFVGLLIQFAIREIRRKALDVIRQNKVCVPGKPTERIVTSWQPKT